MDGGDFKVPVDWLVDVLGHRARAAIVMMGSPRRRFIKRAGLSALPF